MTSRLLLVAALAISACSAPESAQTLAALETRVDRLETQIEQLESVRAIKRLQYAYGHYVELGLWNDFGDLFTDDAITNYQQGARGRTEIRDLFFDQVGQGRLGLAEGRIYPHILFQPVITLSPDGRSAKGRWRILAMLGGYGGSATWYSGVYENEYVLENGVWRISLLRSEPRATAAYTASGWKDSGTHVPTHYTAESVTTPIPAASSTSQSSEESDEPAPSLESLSDRVNDLARRAERLNDQAEVTNLQDTYGYAIDGKHWDQVADLFAENGTLELGLRGVYAGKTGIRRGLDQFGPEGIRDGELNDHVYLETLVTVVPDGRTAMARGIELILSSPPGGGNAELSEGVFENTFVKQDGAWKIQSVHFYPRMIVDAAKGWAKSAKAAPGPSKEFPPDRPPTDSYEIYPKFAVAPFHFDNPVTGQPPQYPEEVLSAVRPEPSPAAEPNEPAIGNIADLEAALTEAERNAGSSEAYDAAENLVDACGYSLDDASSDASGLFVESPQDDKIARFKTPEGILFATQILQPVIDVAPDGKSASIRARVLGIGGISEGAGYWTAGTFEGEIVSEQGAWKFKTTRAKERWSAAYPGGWGSTRQK